MQDLIFLAVLFAFAEMGKRWPHPQPFAANNSLQYHKAPKYGSLSAVQGDLCVRFIS